LFGCSRPPDTKRAKPTAELPPSASGVTAVATWVLTDVAMPDMTGFELIGSLRAEGATVPIIAMSGSLVVTDLEVVRHAKALGAVHLLGKPFSFEELIAAINAALSTIT
jgi:FixJ family two-component response regulator